ncbi:glycerophosphodiester phosphodiesterase [Putridiphycobacter roseus]|nr:glycerophosphodiester phosphodiesterase family protein [Putridiphycobacter roseus]
MKQLIALIQATKFLWVFCIVLVLLNNSCSKNAELPLVTVYAHAGMSLYEERTIYPANSFEGIKHSVEVLNAEGIEIDIQLTKDSILVLFHDPKITNSPGFDGCIGLYDWAVLQDLTLNYSTYKIVPLAEVLDYAVAKEVKVYLDIKTFNYCTGKSFPLEVMAAKLDSLTKDYSIQQKKLIVAGSFNISLLSQIKLPNLCLETVNPDSAVKYAELNGFNYIVFPTNEVDSIQSQSLIDTPLNWGVFGGKSNGEIKNTVGFRPSFIISDNFVFTQKITR